MKAIIFSEPDFKGTSQELPIGRHDMKVLESGIGNDTLSSLKVSDGLKVTLFKHAGFDTEIGVYQQDTRTLNADNRQASSVAVELLPGYFYRLMAQHSGKVLEIREGRKDNGTDVIQNPFQGDEKQQFEFFPLEDGYYKIVNRHSQKSLGIEGGSLEDIKNLVQDDWQDQDHQKWALEWQEGGSYKITNKHSGKVIDVSGADRRDNWKVHQYSWKNADNQRFHIERVVDKKPADSYFPEPDSPYRIYSVATNQPAGVVNDDKADGAQVVQQLVDVNRSGQLFQFIPLGVGNYKIQNVNSGKCLSIKNGENGNGVLAIQEAWTEQLHQIWRLSLTEDGNFILTAQHSQKVLDLHGGIKGEGIKIQQWQPLGNTHQKFRLEQTTLLPVVLRITPPAAVCAPSTVDLTAEAVTAGSDAGTLTYFTDADLTQPVPDPTTVGSGTYYIQLTMPDGRTANAAVLATVHPQPKLPITNPATVCWDKKTDLTAAAITTGSDAGTLTYFKDAALTQPVPDPKAVDAGTYYIRLTTDKGCTIAQPVVTTAHPKPKLVITNPATVCWDKKTDLTAAAITTGRDAGTLTYFKDAALSQPVPGPKAVDAGTYYIRLTTDKGCTVAQPVTATAHPKPKLVITNPATVCWDKKTDLTAAAITAGRDPGALAFFKDAALTQPVPDPKAVEAGTYYIQLTTDKGCTIAQPVEATAYPQPKLTIAKPATVCWDKKTDLTAAAITAGSDAGTLTYFKDAALTQPVPAPKAVEAGTYYIQLTTDKGCTIAKPVEATVHPQPKLPIVKPATVCWDKKTDLTAEAITAGRDAGALAYFKDAALAQPVADPKAVEAGTYYIRLTVDNGCTIAKPVEATVHPQPKLPIANPAPACGNNKIDLTAAAITAGRDPGTLAYFKDAALTQPIPDPRAVETGTYYIQLTTDKGCTIAKPVEAIIHPLPALAVNDPVFVCAGMKVNLVTAVVSPVSNTDKLEYFLDEALTQKVPDPTKVDGGAYFIKLSNQYGCFVSKPLTVVVNPIPKLEVVSEEWAYIPEKVDLTAKHITAGSNSGTLAYFKDAALTQKVAQPQAVEPGTYYLQLTSPAGCKSEVKAVKAVFKTRQSMIVPIHVDARYIPVNTVCASPRLDHSRLPYFNGKQDINPYTPYLGEELEAVPFKNGEFELHQGIHLHWALPDFLTKSFRYPMLDLGALRRATRVNRLGEAKENLYTELFKIFIDKGWVKKTGDNQAYASILAEPEQIDIAISELLVDPDKDKAAMGHEILRVRSLLEPGGTQMPPVPNQWRVIRMNGSTKEKEWIVESDFLRPADQGDYQTGVPFPIPDPKPEDPPYGWMGRKYEAGKKPTGEPGTYLGMPLTTLGYGDPSFAAFYPNCHSVFGLHDDTAAPGANYTYEIYGYYANGDYEYLDILREDLKNRSEPGQLSQMLSAFYRENLELPLEEPRAQPKRLVCCGQVRVKAQAAPNIDSGGIKVTIGSTSTEAVSAYLADGISSNKKVEVEEYLESLRFSSRLEHLKTDIGPKLREERHRQTFSSEKGGYRWVLIPRQAMTNAGDDAIQQVSLAADYAYFLNELNEIQLAFDRCDEQIKALRQQIFADWSKYMACQYPPDGADDDYPDTDQARFFIEFNLMPKLATLNAERQWLAKALRDHMQSFWHFRPGDIMSPAGLFQGMWQSPDLKPWLDADAETNEAGLVNSLNRFIDNKGYNDAALEGEGQGKSLSLDEILQRQVYQNHLLENRLALENLFPDFLPKHPDFILKRKPHRRFHRPVDPVVLLTGDTLKTTRKHGQDGLLPNKLIDKSDWVWDQLVNFIRTEAQKLIPADWQTVPDRHPLLLDWLVEFFPVEDTDFDLDTYNPEYLLDKYSLDLNTVDLKAKKEDLYSAVGQTFWGSALLTSGGGKSLMQSLETFLIAELALTEEDLKEIAKHRETYFKDDSWMQQYAGVGAKQAVTPANFDAFYAWTPPDITPENLRELWASKHRALALLAYEKLEGTNFLSQALGGFTPAMLMLRQGYQLKIADPLGYPEYQDFSRRVNNAVGLLNHASTLPNNPFFPIRAGAASLLELRLLDTFGQEIVHLTDIQDVLAAETLAPQHSHHHFELTPRLSQPTRLSFHWLSATDDLVEQNEHPASSPICGWVLLNYLDESLMIYDQYGEALGYLDREGHWRSFPGHTPAILAEGIPNWHLRRMVLWLMKKAKRRADENEGQSETLPHFIELVAQALQKIEPPRADHAGEGVAMLMSRPLALVRAVAQLEIKGLPAVHQGWQQFNAVINDPEGGRESTLDIENVAFPLRIGEDHQLNDGLVGFWEDAFDGEAYEGDVFRIPALNEISDGNTVDTDAHTLDTLTIGAEGSEGRRITFNMLMDPHGSVHATCGILPVQALELPKDMYYEALQRLEVSFLTAPLITPRQTVHLSLPNEPGFQWSWIDTDKRQWREISTVGHFRKRELLDEFGAAGEALWQELLERQWIALQGDQATIVPKNRRPPETGDFPPATLAPQLEHFLESRLILTFQMIPSGLEGQEIREGWLKLRPAPELPSPAEETEDA